MPQSQRRTLVESITRLSRRGASKNLKKILQRVRPADLAGLLDQVNDAEVLKIFALIEEPQRRADTLSEAIPELQRQVLRELDDLQIIELLDQLFADDAVNLLKSVPEDRAERILEAWKSPDSASVDSLMGYEPGTAGAIMSPEFFALTEETTVDEAIKTLQVSHHDLEMVFYLYVVNELGQLYGVCSLRQLVVSSPERTLAEICETDLISAELHTHQEKVARSVARYNLLAIPIVDENNTLVGIITVDDVIDVIREEATEDLFKMSGTDPESFEEGSSVARSARARMPWLLASFCAGSLSMFVIGRNQDTIASIAVLAAFIPITLGMGGNVGTQSATLMVRSIALGRASTSRILRVVGREIMVGAVGGLIYGLALAVLAWAVFFQDAQNQVWTIAQLSATVSLSVFCCMSAAAAFGAGVPLLFERIGIDPAVATNPIVTTATDVVGVLIYFLIASLLLPI